MRSKTNVDLFRDTYKSTVVPAHCTASQLSGISEDFCYWGKRVRGGVTLEDASEDLLNALRLHSDLTGRVIAEQTKCGRSFDYVRVYLFVQFYFLQQEKTDEHLAHLRRRHQGFKVNQLQEGPPHEGYSTLPAVVDNLLQDPEYPPPAQGESDSQPASPDEELEINIFEQKVTKTGPPCSFCGFNGHKVETCYRKHPHLRPPAGAKRRGLKEGPSCKGCGSTWHTPDQCWKLHPHLKLQPKKAAKPPLKRNWRHERTRRGLGPLTKRAGYPSLRADCLWGEEYAVRLAVVLKGDEQEVLRPPQSAVVDSAARKGLILPGTFFFKSLEPLLSALDFQCIIHTACEALGVIRYELVPDLVRTKADSPIRLIGAGSNSLKGGTHCIHGALLLPVSHKGRYVRARCPNATLYIADIGPRAIVGYPLLTGYGLAVFPGQGSLIFEEHISGETITVPASEPPIGLELTLVERDNPIQSVVPLYSVSAPTVTEDCPSDFNWDEGSVRSVGMGTGRLNALVKPHIPPLVPYEGVHSCTDGSSFVDGCHVPASTGYLCAPQAHDASRAGERAQGSLGTSVPWSERFNSPSPTIDTLTHSEVTAPHGTVDTTHTILNTQSVPQEMMERPSQVLLSPAGTSCGSGPDAQVIPSTVIFITPELEGNLLTPS